MKKLLSLLMALALVGFYACSEGGGEAEDEGTEEATEEPAMEEESTDDGSAAAEEMSEGEEELAEHICADLCDGDNHHYAHGEKGHECGEDCPGMKMEGEDHEGHEHATEEEG